ncbi:MAG: quinolinate synthase NadA [Nitrososphaerota archaeon]|nr:quinolinate synthase NadA [Candidatus Bathyarchaeota archaeon]MDW8048701.1 quinolinate synthase NadA [Nitrososphaerota archaeon]
MDQQVMIEKIEKMKKEKRAVILAHNYQRPEVQDIADFVGDSLELSLYATKTDAKIIVFAGVSFMAETAAILNPDKTVLLPDRNALCPMASMLPAELIKLYREKYPKAKVVLYINTLAEAKAQSDAICTSANSAEIINRLDSDTILFGPDWNLTHYTKKSAKKDIVPIPAYGFCPVHILFNKEGIQKLKKIYPQAEVMAHPECTPEVCAAADFVGSTSKMCREAKMSHAKEFIVATEIGLLHRLRKERSDAVYIPAYEDAVCVNMKLITLEKIYRSLKEERHKIKLPPKIAEQARRAIDIMLEK